MGDDRNDMVEIVASLAPETEDYGVGPTLLSLSAMKELQEKIRHVFLTQALELEVSRTYFDPIPETWEARRARWRGIMKGLRLKTAGRGYRGAPDNSWWNGTPKSARRT